MDEKREKKKRLRKLINSFFIVFFSSVSFRERV